MFVQACFYLVSNITANIKGKSSRRKLTQEKEETGAKKVGVEDIGEFNSSDARDDIDMILKSINQNKRRLGKKDSDK